MNKIGVFYATETGTTEQVAHKIAKALGVADADVHDMSTTAPSRVGDYDLIVLGTCTYGMGELPGSAEDFGHGVAVLDLKGKKIALFGTGDESMSDTFCSGVGGLYDYVANTGAEIVGAFDAEGYDFDHTGAEIGGHIVGLLIDEVNHPDLTGSRIARWTETLK